MKKNIKKRTLKDVVDMQFNCSVQHYPVLICESRNGGRYFDDIDNNVDHNIDNNYDILRFFFCWREDVNANKLWILLMQEFFCAYNNYCVRAFAIIISDTIISYDHHYYYHYHVSWLLLLLLSSTPLSLPVPLQSLLQSTLPLVPLIVLPQLLLLLQFTSEI